MCRANCHKIIKLSGALQEFAAEKEEISNVSPPFPFMYTVIDCANALSDISPSVLSITHTLLYCAVLCIPTTTIVVGTWCS